MSDLAIDVKGLSKSYGNRKVVDNVDMQVATGRIVGFLGPNGSGKTTSLRMLCGLLTPDAGEGQVLGLDFRRVQLAGLTPGNGLRDLPLNRLLTLTAGQVEMFFRGSRVLNPLRVEPQFRRGLHQFLVGVGHEVGPRTGNDL